MHPATFEPLSSMKAVLLLRPMAYRQALRSVVWQKREKEAKYDLEHRPIARPSSTLNAQLSGLSPARLF
jgi:hypothetical protein